MKASELIEKLQKIVAENGDVEIYVKNDEFGVADSIYGINFYPNQITLHEIDMGRWTKFTKSVWIIE